MDWFVVPEWRVTPTQAHGNADGLSRLPLTTQTVEQSKDSASVFNVAQVQSLPVDYQQIQTETLRDPVLKTISTYVSSGWPTDVTDDLKRPDKMKLDWKTKMSNVGSPCHHSTISSTNATQFTSRESPWYYSDESDSTQLLLVEWD